MIKPAILTVDDEPEVLNAIERDLRKHFAADYRILKAGSGAQALEAVRELKKRNAAVALFLVDARMPQMSGTEFLVQARAVLPGRAQGAPHRLRRHRRGHRRHQPRPARPLPHEAVGSAGREALPRPGRPPERLVRVVPPAVRGHPGGRLPVVARGATT